MISVKLSVFILKCLQSKLPQWVISKNSCFAGSFLSLLSFIQRYSPNGDLANNLRKSSTFILRSTHLIQIQPFSVRKQLWKCRKSTEWVVKQITFTPKMMQWHVPLKISTLNHNSFMVWINAESSHPETNQCFTSHQMCAGWCFQDLIVALGWCVFCGLCVIDVSAEECTVFTLQLTDQMMIDRWVLFISIFSIPSITLVWCVMMCDVGKMTINCSSLQKCLQMMKRWEQEQTT